MSLPSRFEVLPAGRDRLGECPVWCDLTQTLWWVDVLSPALRSFNPRSGRCRDHPIDARRIGSLALREAGGLILACDNGLFAYDPDTGKQTFLVDPEPGRAGFRKNDGRVDSAGAFWVGTLREADYAPVGALYRIATDLRVTCEAEKLAIPNSLAFDPDRRRMYFADTRAFTIWACDYDAATGHLGERQVFARTVAPARPDGSCIDAEGHLWNAEYEGGRLVRYAPSGAVSRVIDLPVLFPTCCCFGGRGLERLYVTSATEPLSVEERHAQPYAGRVLVIEPGVRGRREFRTGL